MNQVGDDPANPRDRNGDGMPDFLDPSLPTNLDATPQPPQHWHYLPWLQSRAAPATARVGEEATLHLPAVGR